MCVSRFWFPQLQKRLAKNQMLRDITAEFSSAPEVVGGGRTQAEREADQLRKDRERYEEDNLQRLTLTKAQKKKLAAAKKSRHLNLCAHSLAQFSLSVLTVFPVLRLLYRSTSWWIFERLQ